MYVENGMHAMGLSLDSSRQRQGGVVLVRRGISVPRATWYLRPTSDVEWPGPEPFAFVKVVMHTAHFT